MYMSGLDAWMSLFTNKMVGTPVLAINVEPLFSSRPTHLETDIFEEGRFSLSWRSLSTCRH